MTLGELILALKPLLESPRENSAKIVKLLHDHKSLAEFEVARFYVGQSFAHVVEAQASSPNPAERALAARGIGNVLGRVDGARLLRRMVKDSDSKVRSAARASIRRLGLTDVAVPDDHFSSRSKRPLAPGGWNPTGWSYGIFRPWGYERDKKPLKVKLPAIGTRTELLKLLGIAPKDLDALLRAGEQPGSPYVAFEIPKRSGGTRTIHAPRKKLKALQRKILTEILQKIPTHDACHGFVKKRSIVTNATPHVKSKVVIRFDLHDFFPSIHYRRVAGLFARCGYSADVANVLASLTTHRPRLPDGTAVWPGVLPQGAPTSPALANAVCKRLDARLSALAKKAGAKYTRYADDLTFSFPDEPKLSVGRFVWWVDQICQQEGFNENPTKRRVYRRGNQQRVTGLVVNDKMTIPRERRRRFRALLDHCNKVGLEAMVQKQPGLRAELDGFAAYVRMVQPDLGAKLSAQIKALKP